MNLTINRDKCDMTVHPVTIWDKYVHTFLAYPFTLKKKANIWIMSTTYNIYFFFNRPTKLTLLLKCNKN